MWPTKDFDLLGQLAIVGVTACGLLALFVVVGGLVLLARYLFRRGRQPRSSKP